MSANPVVTSEPTAVPHVIKGHTVQEMAERYGPTSAPFATPKLNLDELIWPRALPGPAFDVPVTEIMDILVATGERLTRDPDGLLGQACEQMKRTSPLDSGVLGFGRERLSDLVRLLGLVRDVSGQTGPPRRRDRPSGVVVDQLGEDPSVRAEDDEPRPLGRSRDLAANTAMPPDPGLALRENTHARLPTFRRTCSST